MQTVVIKLGGSSLNDENTLEQLTSLIESYKNNNSKIVVVHGGGPAINKALTEKGIQWQFINGQRQTTVEMMTVIDRVLSVDINSMIVNHLNQHHLLAVGLSGATHQILSCVPASDELIQVGKITKIHLDSIEQQLNLNHICVVSPVGFGSNGTKYNINADWAAAQIAIALQAKELIYLTDQMGVLDENKKIIHLATPSLLHKLIADQVIIGGMMTKVLTMINALENGVSKIVVISAKEASLFPKNTDHFGTSLINH